MESIASINLYFNSNRDICSLWVHQQLFCFSSLHNICVLLCHLGLDSVIQTLIQKQ